MNVKLYGYATSPFARKTACFLYYKGIEFDHVPVNPLNPNDTLSHTGGTQIPVLEIDGEYRRESSDHAYWLDELFPDKPLCPDDHKATVGEIDHWISDTYLRSMFRVPEGSEFDLQFRFRAWRLAALVSAHTPLTEEDRNNWPDLVRNAPFIKKLADRIDYSESRVDMQHRVFNELLKHLGAGPFLGELDEPTMLDLAIFPQMIMGYMFGLEDSLSAAAHPAIKSWMRRVSKHLPANPTLIADHMQINALSDGLA